MSHSFFHFWMMDILDIPTPNSATEEFPFFPFIWAWVTSLFAAFSFASDLAATRLTELKLKALFDEINDEPRGPVDHHIAEAREIEKRPPSPLFRLLQHRHIILSRWLILRILALSTSSLLWMQVSRYFGDSFFWTWFPVLGSLFSYGSMAAVMGRIAQNRPVQVASLGLRFFFPFEWLVAPIAAPFSFFGNFISRKIPSELNPRVTDREVELVVSQSERSGVIGEDPAEMIRNVLDFKDLTARDVMVPRRKISAIEVNTKLSEVLAQVSREGHSRYLVYQETLDHIVGLLHAKDLFRLIEPDVKGGELESLSASKPGSLKELMRSPVLFSVESQSALSLLKEMRAKRQHMVVVTDEFGGTDGLVTMEDILEEIVGDIDDEYDTESETEKPVQKLGPNRFFADASVSISDLETHLLTPLPSEEEYESLGGMLTNYVGKLPVVGTTISLYGMDFIVREADETHISKVEIIFANGEIRPDRNGNSKA